MKRHRVYALLGKRDYPRAMGAIVGYWDSPILHIGESIKSFTTFVNNIYKVCELQGHYSIISSHIYVNHNFNGRDIKMSEKLEIIPYKVANSCVHIFRIVSQELYSTYCGDDSCDDLYYDYSGCIMHEGVDTTKPYIRSINGYYLIVDTTHKTIKVMTDIALKDNGLY